MTMQVNEAIERFQTYQRANDRSPHTIDCYRRDLKALARFSGNIQIQDVNHDLIHAFIVSPNVQVQKGGAQRSQATINRAKAALRAFGAWLVMTENSSRNPAEGLSIRRTARKSPTTFTDTERKRILREVRARSGDRAERDRAMLEVLLGTGIRLAELVGLDLEHLDLENKRFTIQAKGGNAETRFISVEMRSTLRRYLRHRGEAQTDNAALFLSNRGTRISARQVQARFQLWIQWAGITRSGFSVHSTRHTFGTRLYRRTKDMVLVGRALGHRTLEATAIYVHQDDDALSQALEGL